MQKYGISILKNQNILLLFQRASGSYTLIISTYYERTKKVLKAEN